MASVKEIRILNPFNMQHGGNGKMHLYLQEVVNYAESRFSAAILGIERVPDVATRGRMQKMLQEELVNIVLLILSRY